jgi:DNA polymerase-3 subunit alpha/error-prone DNA polymerase
MYNYKILVAASSIIRPGVAQSGMMKEYILDTTTNQFEYFHETFKEHLGETYGVMVYQEDVIKLHCTLQEYPPLMEMFCAAMSGKGRSVAALQKVKTIFLHVVLKGHPLALSQEIYRQIESFAGYSFLQAPRLLCR